MNHQVEWFPGIFVCQGRRNNKSEISVYRYSALVECRYREAKGGRRKGVSGVIHTHRQERRAFALPAQLGRHAQPYVQETIRIGIRLRCGNPCRGSKAEISV